MPAIHGQSPGEILLGHERLQKAAIPPSYRAANNRRIPDGTRDPAHRVIETANDRRVGIDQRPIQIENYKIYTGAGHISPNKKAGNLFLLFYVR